MKDIKLNNGTTIPQIGFGTWQTPDGDVAVQAVKHALEAGYTHIDTAQMYRNEASVGKAIKESGIDRKSLYITTKLGNTFHSYQGVIDSVNASLKALQTDYIDLLLIHWPNPISVRETWEEANSEAWRAMEDLHNIGKIRSLGISNFMIHHIDALLKTARVLPVVNQVFLAPGGLQDDLIAYCEAKGIVLEAYSPLGTGKIFEVPLMSELADKYQKTLAQVAIRWSLQHGFIPLPKSVTESRIKENLDVFDFELSVDDMERIDALHDVAGAQLDPDTTNF